MADKEKQPKIINVGEIQIDGLPQKKHEEQAPPPTPDDESFDETLNMLISNLNPQDSGEFRAYLRDLFKDSPEGREILESYERYLQSLGNNDV